MFGQPIPSFNLNGEEVIKTYLGAYLSMIMTIAVLAYTIIKVNHLVIHYSPNISTYPIDIDYDESTPFDLNASTIRPAFAFTRWTIDE